MLLLHRFSQSMASRGPLELKLLVQRETVFVFLRISMFPKAQVKGNIKILGKTKLFPEEPVILLLFSIIFRGEYNNSTL